MAPGALRARAANLPSRDDMRAFRAGLRGPHRTSALRAVGDGLLVAVVLRTRGLRPLLRPAGADTAAGSDDASLASAVSTSVDAGLGVLPLAPTCLRRSVTLLRELRRVGVDAGLHIGVRSTGGTIEAHAWIQVGEDVVNDDARITSTYGELVDGRFDHVVALLR